MKFFLRHCATQSNENLYLKHPKLLNSTVPTLLLACETSHPKKNPGHTAKLTNTPIKTIGLI